MAAPGVHDGRDVCRDDPLQLRPELVSLLGPDGIDLTRDEPVDPPSPRELAAIVACSAVARRVLAAAHERSGTVDRLSDAEVEAAAREVLRAPGLTDQMRVDAWSVLDELREALIAEGAPDSVALPKAVRTLSEDLCGAHDGDRANELNARAVVVRALLRRAGGLAFTRELRVRREAFYRGLGLPKPEQRSQHDAALAAFAPYYCLVDFLDLAAQMAKEDWRHAHLLRALQKELFSPWQLIRDLARFADVAVLPAASFFGDPTAHRWTARVSVANPPLPWVRLAAERIRGYFEVLTPSAGHVISDASLPDRTAA